MSGARRTAPLREMVTFRGGGTPSTERPEMWHGVIPWVSPKDMKSDIITESIDSITAEAIDSSATRLIPSGASLVVVRSGILARTVPIAIAGRELALNQDIKALCPNDSLDPYFLFFFLQSSEQHLLSRVTKGATVHRLATDDLRGLEIPVLPLREQKRIVETLTDALQAIAKVASNTEKSAANAKALVTSMLDAIFARPRDGWLTTNVQALVDQGVLHRPIDGNHGDIHPKISDYVEHGVPFIMASDLRNGHADTTRCKHITRELANSLRTGFAKNGDVLLSHKGTIGSAAVLDTPDDYVMLTPQVTFYRILDTSKLLPRFVYYYFLSPPFQRELSMFASGGSTRAYAGITKQLELTLILPPLADQEAVVEQLDALTESTGLLQRNCEARLSKLSALRESLLDAAYNGNV